MSMKANDKIWYLWDGEKQTGPFSTVAMKKSIALGKLKPDRLVFREGFEDWKKLGETELWVRRPVPSLQSSLTSIGNASASNAPNAQVNEVFLWLLACSPGIGLLVSAVLKLCSSCSEDLCGGLGCLSFWVLNCVFARNDELLVKEVGGKSPNAIWGAIPISRTSISSYAWHNGEKQVLDSSRLVCIGVGCPGRPGEVGPVLACA